MDEQIKRAIVSLRCDVEIAINDPSAITRVTGPEGDDWRHDLYQLFTEGDVLNHFAFNCLVNGVTDAGVLEGWADLQPGAVTMRVARDSIEQESYAITDRAAQAPKEQPK